MHNVDEVPMGSGVTSKAGSVPTIRERYVYLVIDTERWNARDPDAYAPPDLSAGPVRCQDPEDINPAARALDQIGKKPVLLEIDTFRSGPAIADGWIVGPIPISAVLRAAPLLRDREGGFAVRNPTPVDHTLYGVLTRVQLEDPDPALRWKLDLAYGGRNEWVRRRCAAQLWGFSPQAVDDVVQEVLIESWKHVRGAYRPDASFKAFLGGIALHICRNARRKQRNELLRDQALMSQIHLLFPASASVLDRLEWEQLARLLTEAAQSVLSPLDQEIALMRYHDHLPFAEIARLKRLDGVKAVHNAMERIRRALGKELARRVAVVS